MSSVFSRKIVMSTLPGSLTGDVRVARLVIQDGATFSGKVSMGPQAAEAAMAPPPELEAESAPEMQTGPAAATDGRDKPASGKGKPKR